ncbi:MAG: biotin--[acetyl-CoA-carboxylase] ligase [Actinobacteria bacterium]|nr:biotin--[acetyl-CoA-carboxylase] ligase [Actinomycetota bacterium]
MPTPRLQALLEGPSPWYRVDHREEVASTNDVAAELAATGAAPGLVVVADRQTAGRGRAGRTWVDRPGGSLLCSCLVETPSVPTLVPLAAGLAVHHAVRRQGSRAELKWPNDVLIDGAKCGGVLVENPGGGVLVVGTGIDLDWRGEDRSGEASGWTSIAEHTGRDVDRWEVLADVLAAFSSWLLDVGRDPRILLASYEARCVTLRNQVRVETGSDVVEGVARSVDPDGALVVQTPDGLVRVTSGDVS